MFFRNLIANKFDIQLITGTSKKICCKLNIQTELSKDVTMGFGNLTTGFYSIVLTFITLNNY